MIGAVTGGRDHWPTLAELERLAAEARARGVTVMRDGDCPTGLDRIARGYLHARGVCAVDKWPAAWAAMGKKAGHLRNAAMLRGDRLALTGDHSLVPTEHAQVLFAFRGNAGTADCVVQSVALGIDVVGIDPVAEPRIWNMYHRWSADESAPPGLVYCGRSRKHGGPSPLANRWRVDVQPGETRASAARRILGAYRRWLWERIEARDPNVLGALDSLTPNSWVGCTCWPAHCHAEVIVRAWRWMTARGRNGATAAGVGGL